MLRLVIAITVLIGAASSVSHAAGCIGKRNDHDLKFISDPSGDGALIVRRNINGSSREDLLDDTGYLSAAIMANYLMNSDENKVINSTEKSESIRLLRLRLKKLRAGLVSNGLDASSLSVTHLDHLDRVLNRSSIVKESLGIVWMGLESSLKKEQVHISVRAKYPESSVWGKEEPIAEFAVPSITDPRDTACKPKAVKVDMGDSIQASIEKKANEGLRQNSLNSYMKSQSGTK